MGLSGNRRILVALIVVAFVGQGLFYSRTLISSDDEESYLSAGYFAVTGQISLYQDDMTGQRMPLPFYVLGASQVAFGRNLWAGRLVSLLCGMAALLLTMQLARRLGGDLAAFLAGALLATQGAVVSYYATAAYHSLAALALIGTVLLLVDGRPLSIVLGAAGVAALFFTRTNLFPALPLLGIWALVGARSAPVRSVVTLAMGGPVALFFLSDPTHLKLLAHVPFLDHLVEHLGYRSVLYFEPVAPGDRTGLLRSVALLARRYESWTLCGAVVLGGWLVMRVRGDGVSSSARRFTVVGLAGLAAWILLWHFVIFRVNFKWVVAYFPDFAPLVAVVLGVSTAQLVTTLRSPRLVRAALLTGLALSLLISVVFVRNPLMPRPIALPFRSDSIQVVEGTARTLRELVSTGVPVFLYGQSMPVYLAGLRAYLPQMMTPRSLTMHDQDDYAVTRSGVWGRRQLEQWLGEDAQYAIVSPRVLQAYEADRSESIGRMRALLAERFVRIGQVADAPWLTYEVYRRRSDGG